MSSECEAIYSSGLDGIEREVIELLQKCGYVCEFAPHTMLLSQSTELIFLRVLQYPSPKARVKPERSFIVGLEVANRKLEEEGLTSTFIARTNSGRSRLQTAMQYLLCAAIANLRNGEFYDPQNEKRTKGAGAIKYVLELLQNRDPPHDLREQEFVGWPAPA